jgi:hypothetical protein
LLLSHRTWNIGYHGYSLVWSIPWTTLSKWQRTDLERNYLINEIIIFPLWTFHFYVATFQQHIHIAYISLSGYDITELVLYIRIPVFPWLLLKRKQHNQEFLVVKLKSSHKHFSFAILTYVMSVSQMTMNMFHLLWWQSHPFTVHNLSPNFDMCNTCATIEAGTADPAPSWYLMELRLSFLCSVLWIFFSFV